jgi:SAM-dependent methyltransferase
MMMFNASEFYQLTHERPPWPQMMRAAAMVAHGDQAPRVLDLGCGAGRDTRYLLAQGFDVTAVDENAEALSYLRDLPQDRLHLVQSSFENYPFTPYAFFDLISAQFSLPFSPPATFPEMFARLKASLRPGGVFAGHFFGVNDQWNREGRPLTFVTREQAEELLRGLEVIELREEEVEGHVANGNPKYWHIFHVLARRPLARE